MEALSHAVENFWRSFTKEDLIADEVLHSGNRIARHTR